MEVKGFSPQNFLSRLTEKARERFGLREGKKYGIQTKIAEATGIDQRTVSNWFDEDKEAVPNAEHLVKVCEALHTSPNYLLLGSDETRETKEESLLASSIKNLIGQISPNKEIDKKEVPLIFTIFELTDKGLEKDEHPDLLLIQKRIYGRRKNFIPIKINRGDHIDILLLEKQIRKHD